MEAADARDWHGVARPRRLGGVLTGSTPWHALTPEAVAEALGTDESTGLTELEAQLRLERDGPNELAESTGPSALQLIIAQFTNVPKNS